IAPRNVDDLARQMKVDLLSTLCEDLLPNIYASARQEDLFKEFAIDDRIHPSLSRLITSLLASELSKTDYVVVQPQGMEEVDEDTCETMYSEQNYKYEIIQTSELIDYFHSKSSLLLILLRLMNLVGDNLIKADSLELAL